MDSLFALGANSKEAMEERQRRGHHFKNIPQGGGGDIPIYKCNVESAGVYIRLLSKR